VGLSVEDHAYLSREIGALGEALRELKEVVRAGEGSASPGYLQATVVERGLKRWKDLLRGDLMTAHGRDPDARPLYPPEGQA
jgi:hypothetical protein